MEGKLLEAEAGQSGLHVCPGAVSTAEVQYSLHRGWRHRVDDKWAPRIKVGRSGNHHHRPSRERGRQVQCLRRVMLADDDVEALSALGGRRKGRA